MAVEPSPWQSPGVRVLAALAALAVTTVLIVLFQPSSGSGQFNFAAGLGGQHAAGLALPGTDPGGLCRYNYSIKTWSGEEALTCDPAICRGADKLQLMPAPMLKQRRWSSFDEATYLDLVRSRRINGWLQVRLYASQGEGVGLSSRAVHCQGQQQQQLLQHGVPCTGTCLHNRGC